MLRRRHHAKAQAARKTKEGQKENENGWSSKHSTKCIPRRAEDGYRLIKSHPEDNNMQSAGLYIHIPFCRSKCNYCGFYSIIDMEHIPEYLDAIGTEMELYQPAFRAFDTIYFGGGTPSVLTPTQITGIMERAKSTFDFLPGTEITMEMNPADVSFESLRILKQAGINRLNIGIQSFNDDVLGFLGRRHTTAQAIQSFDDACRAGFENIGIDLMYGIPGQDIGHWIQTLAKAISMKVPHLSCYELSIETGTPLEQRYASGELNRLTESLSLEFFLRTSEMLEDEGYHHYEVSNFARSLEIASRHNQKYWDHSPYLGLGPAAHSFIINKRWWNHRSLSSYIKALRKGERTLSGAETLSKDQTVRETLMLGLRTSKGIYLPEFNATYGMDLQKAGKKQLQELAREGYLVFKNGWMRPTRKGLAVADRLALILDEMVK
jgi:oxygen-independent coproporphyrinogen-3 oxidase